MPVSVIIPAYRAADTVAETVAAARTVAGVGEVIVVDDGSGDDTAEAARRGGAHRVVVLARNRGKGHALTAGIEAAQGDRVLFLDADLGSSAAQAGALLDAIGDEDAMAVAVLPPSRNRGGFGLLRRFAQGAIRLLTGLQAAAPLSGQRALPARVVRQVGIAPCFGVEVALTAEVAHLGLPVREVPVPFDHQGTGRDAAGFAHRGRQFWDVVRVVAATGYGIGWPALAPGRVRLRLATWIAGLLAVMALCWTTAPLARPWLAAACGAALLVWLPCLWIAGVWLGLRRPNYLGRMVPSATGIIFPAVCLPIFWATPLSEEVRAAGVAVVGVMGAVGLLDDMFGSRRQARGLRGHLLALFRGQLTTGILKAAGGLAVGVWAGLLLDWGEPWLIATDAVLIALAANAANLLDLRPGRALKGFVMLAGVLLLLAPNAIHLLGPLLAAAVVSAPADLSGRAMMGDVGSNVLGGVVGLLLAIALGPWQRLGAVAMLMLFHLFCERMSLSALIARSPFLNAIDRLGTTHLPPLTPAETRQ